MIDPLIPNPTPQPRPTFPRWGRWLLIAALVTGGVLIAAPDPAQPMAAPAVHHQQTVRYGDRNHTVEQVQAYLYSRGYDIEVDGWYGPQTYRHVTHFQRRLGLAPDGVVGPVTRAAMVTATAVRMNPPSPPAGGGGHRCPQYVYLLVRYSLPVWFFDPVMYRESRCQPDAYNGRNRDRSYGLLQINTKGDLWGELQRRCGLSYREQLFNPDINIRCASRLYAAYGTRPWRT